MRYLKVKWSQLLIDKLTVEIVMIYLYLYDKLWYDFKF